MQLPGPLREAIEREFAACDGAQLRAAASRLSRIYRDPRERNSSGAKGTAEAAAGAAIPSGGGALASSAMAGDLERAAYLAVRMPATFAAVSAALSWTREACGEGFEIRSLLDLGSGPGTALWAAAQLFPMLDSATAVERDAPLIELGRLLAENSEDTAVRQTRWLRGDLTAELPAGQWELVVCSYALNEIGETQRAALIAQAWARCSKLLVIIEPGTRAGFAHVLAVRAHLLAAGATSGAALISPTLAAPTPVEPILVAPCPHSLACPMAATGDWCHFAARVERTAIHRRLKEATLGHEDEKFSYVAFLRNPHLPKEGRSGAPSSFFRIPESQPQARIVRHPRLFSGYAQLTLCRAGEIAEATVTRSQKEDWRRLKRLGWGDRW